MSSNSWFHRGSDVTMLGGGTLLLLVATGVTALTLCVAFGLLALGVRLFWVVFPVGFGVVLPGAIAVSLAFYTRSSQSATTSQARESPTSTERLRRRYVEGDLSDEEFEHRVTRFLESETDRQEDDPGTNTGRG